MRISRLTSIAVGAFFALAGAASQALVIGFSPPAQNIPVGATADVNVVISDLTAAGEIVSGFHISVSYSGDPTVQFLSGEYGLQLGITDIETISFAPSAAGGVIDLFNSSLLSEGDLDLLQGDSVVLATLHFRSNVPITSNLSISFTPNDISGRLDQGTQLPNALNPDPTPGTITWFQRNGQPVPVPLPGTLLLLAGPLAWLAGRRTK